jgi:hypothetical protein
MPPRRRASPAPKRTMPSGRGRVPPTDVYEIQVTLLGTRPPVWRRILVPGNLTLGRLHAVLQIAMGWPGGHMHQFRIGGKRYGDMADEMDDGESLFDGDQDDLTVGRAFKTPRPKVIYEYDFGDSWEHELKVVKVHPPEAAPGFGPECVAGERACPPEDCGGIPGYEHLLEVLADPQHEEHKDLSAWVAETVEGPFDPGRFDRAAVNRDLQRLR